MMKTHLLMFSFMLSVLPTTSLADSEYDRWLNNRQQAFKQFKDARDIAFMGYLKKQWQAFELYKGMQQDSTPKPAKAPSQKHAIGTWSDIDLKSSPHTIHTLDTPRLNLPENIQFYGHQIPFLWDSTTPLPNTDKPDQHTIAESWERLSHSEYENNIKQFQQVIKQYELGHWASIQLARLISNALYQEPNNQTIFSWFLLTKAGLDIRVAYTKTQVILLVGSEQTIYGSPYLTIKHKNYYVIDELNRNTGSVVSYPDNRAYTNQRVDLRFTKTIKATNDISTQHLSYRQETNVKEVTLNYDLGIASFLSSYPQIDLKYYFQSSPSAPLANSLFDALRKETADKNLREAANFILSFVQTAFTYQRDEEQFGEENYLLIEESFHYLNNDCEDRSVVTAWLLHNLLNLQVLILDYPGHVALAIELSPQAGDWAATIQGRTFIMADPTYIGATVGMVMPDLAQIKPEIITP